MPELPEVETIIRDLRLKILDLKISKIDILLPRIVKNRQVIFKKELTGNKFKSIERLGKVLIFFLTKGDKVLLVHLKMTGQLVYSKGKKIIIGGHDDGANPRALPNKWTRAVFYFVGRGKLYYNDLRTFGYLKLVNPKELEKIKQGYGSEPLTAELTLELFKRQIKKRKTSIKAILLNQKIIAGLGNIYVDEILFRAGIRPARKASGLKTREIEAIFRSIRPVLERAIKARGTTFNNYVDADGNIGNFVSRLNVYGRQGKKCKKCETEIKKIKVAGRGTHYCPQCQK